MEYKHLKEGDEAVVPVMARVQARHGDELVLMLDIGDGVCQYKVNVSDLYDFLHEASTENGYIPKEDAHEYVHR